MSPHGTAAQLALASAALLVIAQMAISRALARASTSRRQAVASFAGGVSLAFVTLDLLVELVAGSGSEADHLHESASTFETIAVLLLAGIVAAFVADTYASRRESGRLGYMVAFAPRVVYGALVGAALVEEARESPRGFALFWLAMAIHLGVTDHWLAHTFEKEHRPRSRWIFAAVLLGGAIVWTMTEPAASVFHALLAVVGGATLLGVFREEIPTALDARLRPFVTGVVLFGGLAALRWQL